MPTSAVSGQSADRSSTRRRLRCKRAQRAASGEWNRLDAEGEAFHERVHAGYRALAAAEPQRWVVLDATQPLEALAGEIWRTVEQRLRDLASPRR